ncbi:MAG: hypothetical protein HZB37_07200 [Planctomycetes bacterium]|nr:hypothetical protein [Planctomycetota bacterium]
MAILLGSHLIAFSVYTKVFAVSEGLLPEDALFAKVTNLITLETGILTGLGFVLLGIGLVSYSAFAWWKAGFGNLSYPASLRITIPGITMTVLGIQIIFSIFFLSILRLSRKRS